MPESARGGQAIIPTFEHLVTTDAFWTRPEVRQTIASFFQLNIETDAEEIDYQMARLEDDEQTRHDYQFYSHAMAEIEEQAWKRDHYDSMTGLLNKKGWMFYTQHAMARVTGHNKLVDEGKLPARRQRVISYLLDINRFKEVNDERGHECGDELIIAFGARLAEAVRQQDVVGFRLSGDEFALTMIVEEPDEELDEVTRTQLPLLEEYRERRVEDLPAKERAQRAVGRLETIAQEVMAPWDIRGLDISVGAAVWDGQETIEQFLKRLDELMYQTKDRKAYQLYMSNSQEDRRIAEEGLRLLRRAGTAGRDILRVRRAIVE